MVHGIPSHDGTSRRSCANLLYLDSDAFLTDFNMSVDGYLAAKRVVGDEAVAFDEGWQLLFSYVPHLGHLILASNFPPLSS